MQTRTSPIKSFLVPGLASLCLFVLIAFQVFELISLNRAVDQTEQVVSRTHWIESDILAAASATRGFLRTRDQEFLEGLNKKPESTFQAILELRSLAGDVSSIRDRINKLEAAHSQWFTVSRALVEERLKGRLSSSERISLSNQLIGSIQEVLAEIRRIERELRLQRSAAVVKQARIVVASTTVALMLIGAWIFFILLERGRQDEQLRRSEEKYRVATRMREETLAIVSHDLKNPIASIHLTSQLIQRILAKNPAPEKGMSEMLASIQRSANQATQLIEDILDAEKVEMGNLVLDEKTFRVSELLAEVTDLFMPIAADRKIQLESSLSPGDFEVLGDRKKLGQVLSNFVSNSLKFSPAHSVVKISSALLPEGACFTVEDQGPGIPKESSQLVFERFWQGGPEAKKQGTGLGLFIAKGIVEAHGGRIWVDSEPGRPCKFNFLIPK